MLSHRHPLDASIGAPGPHDFAVRMMPFVRVHAHCNIIAATASRTDVRDDAYVPLVGQDGAEYARIPKKRNREIFRERAGQTFTQPARRANHLVCRQQNRLRSEHGGGKADAFDRTRQGQLLGPLLTLPIPPLASGLGGKRTKCDWPMTAAYDPEADLAPMLPEAGAGSKINS